MKLYNDRVFDNKLKDVPVSWSKNLTKTAGYCRNRKMFVILVLCYTTLILNLWYCFRGCVRKAEIQLSEKVLTSADRVRDTLVHELCHAAVWIVDGERSHHGKVWKYW